MVARRGFAGRWPKQSRIALALSVLVLAAGFVDYSVTADSLPRLSPSATVDDPAFDERDQIREDFGQRIWIYGGLALLFVGVAVALSVRAADAEGRRQIFVDLGVAGVLVGALSWYTASREPELTGDSNGEGVFALVPVAMLVVAAAGGLVTRTTLALAARRSGSGPVEPVSGSAGQAISRVALGLAALTIVLVALGSADRVCGDASGESAQNLALWAAFFASLGAAGAGLGSLAARRWIAALVTIPMPAVAVVAILAAACLE